MDIIVGFSRARSKFKVASSINQLVENRPYSHVYLKFVLFNVIMVAQASHGYVNFISFMKFDSENETIYTYRLSCENDCFSKVLLPKIFNLLGSKYSYTQLLLIAIKKLFKLEMHWYNKSKYFISSEFAAIICKSLGVNVNSELDYITPSDLEQILKDNGVPKI